MRTILLKKIPDRKLFESSQARCVRVVSTLIVLGLMSGCTNLIFQPVRQHLTSPDQHGIAYEDVYVETSDHLKLHGWKLPGKKSVDYRGSVIFFHGNGENISTHFANVYWLADYGFNVYLFDYRGYGKSQGVALLDDVMSDMDTMMGYVISQLPDDDKLIVMGHSLGGALSIYGVAQSRYRANIKALVTIEAFSDYHDVAQDMLSTSWLTWLFQWPLSFTIDNSYSPADYVSRLSPIPLLIMHSKNDEMIPFYHAEVLFQAASQPRELLVVDGDHNHVFNRRENREKLLHYLVEELPQTSINRGH